MGTQRIIFKLISIQESQRISNLYNLKRSNIVDTYRVLPEQQILNTSLPKDTKRVIGDGNCMFRSVCYHIAGSDKSYMQLRYLTRVEMLTHPERYPEVIDKAKFVADVSKDTEWCDSPEIVVLGVALQIPIYVFNRNLNPPIWQAFVKTDPNFGIVYQNFGIYIEYINGNHYQPVFSVHSNIPNTVANKRTSSANSKSQVSLSCSCDLPTKNARLSQPYIAIPFQSQRSISQSSSVVVPSFITQRAQSIQSANAEDVMDNSDFAVPISQLPQTLSSAASVANEPNRHDCGIWSKCIYCGAFRWPVEKVSIDSCCNNGKVLLKIIPDPPDLLFELLTGEHPLSRHYLRNIRAYNSTLQMASTSIDFNTKLKGVSFLRAHERIYHRIGSLLPKSGKQPKFAQLYVVDTAQLCGAGGTIAKSSAIPSNLDKSLLIDLITMLKEENHYAKIFRSAVEDNPDSFYIKFNTDPKSRHQYQIPTSDSEIGGLIPDSEQFTEGRYIVVRTHIFMQN